MTCSYSIKRILLPAILFFGMMTRQGYTQQPFPLYADNPSWNVLECFWYACSTETYEYVYDTTFCGKTWSVMPIPGINMRGYLFSDSVRTTFRKSSDCLDKEYLLYDYSMGIGDTLYTGYNLELNIPDDTLAYQLVQVDTVNYFGINRQRFALLYDRCNMGFPLDTVYWVRGIGSLLHPFYAFRCICDFCETHYRTLCYNSNSTLFYQDPQFNTCDTTITGVPDESARLPEIRIIPNPFDHETEMVNYSNGIMELELFAITGRPLKKYRGSNTIRIGQDLVPGVYFVSVRTGNAAVIRKLVKVSRP